MISLLCPIPICPYATPEMPVTVACALLAAQTSVHTSASIAGTAKHSASPNLERRKANVGINEEEWIIFSRRWDAFVIRSKNLNPNSCSSPLFQCAGAEV